MGGGESSHSCTVPKPLPILGVFQLVAAYYVFDICYPSIFEAPLDPIQELALEDPPAPKVRSKKYKFFFKKVKEAMDDIADEEEMADTDK